MGDGAGAAEQGIIMLCVQHGQQEETESEQKREQEEAPGTILQAVLSITGQVASGPGWGRGRCLLGGWCGGCTTHTVDARA